MTRLRMEPAEMPDPRVDEVLKALQIARQNHAGARERLLRVEQMRNRGVALGHRDSMTLRVLVAARGYEVELWDAEVDHLLEQARALGLQP
jgi:hypothetical protein